MSSSKRVSATSVHSPLAGGLTIAIVLAAAGCSADVTRFNLGSLGTTGAIQTPLAPTMGPVHSLALQETTLPPVIQPQRYQVPGRDYGPPPAPHAALKPPPAKDYGPSAKTTPTLADGTGAKQEHAPAAAPPPPGWQRSYLMKSGDSLYAIAAKHKVSLDELKRVNGITDPTKVWAGTALLVPGRSEPAADPSPPLVPRVVQVKPRIIRAAPEELKAAPDPSQIMAKRSDIITNAVPPPAVATGKFRWPVRGKVIVGFGPQLDGSKYDGINLAAPLGTDVHAAEAGVVRYASDGLKTYGHLILIRHDNDWSTAYGHVDQILIKAGDVVKRGQVIAKVGKSGPVAQPQLRFEVRKNSVPIDPLPHLPN